MTTKRTRKELQGLFKQGAMPSGTDFSDFIYSCINLKEDGLEKPVGTDQPLKVTSQGEEENILDLYSKSNEWTYRINQLSSEGEPGLNLKIPAGNSRLFIEGSTGNIGIDTDSPKAKLHIKQTDNSDALRIEDADKDATPFVIDSEGNLGIGTEKPGAKLDLKGGFIFDGGGVVKNNLEVKGKFNLNGSFTPSAGNSEQNGIVFPKDPGGGSGDSAWIRYYPRENENTVLEIGISNDPQDHIALMPSGNVGIGTKEPKAKLDVTGDIHSLGLTLNNSVKVSEITKDGNLNGNSDSAIPTEKAVKTYIDKRLPKGVILMWSGSNVPSGWALCDGKNGTPDLKDRFILGSGNRAIGERKGEESHVLSVDEMPSHNHGGSSNKTNVTHSHGMKTWQDDYNCSGSKKTNQYPSFGSDQGSQRVYHNTENDNINHNHTINAQGGGKAHNNMPPYHVLAYIMKL